MNWQDYEKEIHAYFKTHYPSAEISHNVTIEGRYSKTKRQIDILIEDYVAGNKIRIIIDGKFFSENIDVKDVEMFIGMLNDCEANKGLLITQEGYSKAAINRAYHDPIDIELDILNFKELQQYQASGGLTYSGKHGVLLPAPFGWILDGTRRPYMLGTLYQRGLTLEEAIEKSKEWMYINIKSKDDKIKTLDDLIELQRLEILESVKDPKINFISTIKRSDAITKIRIVDHNTYPTTEYTGFIDFKEFIFICVMFTPEELKKKNIRKLESIMQQIIPVNINHKFEEKH